MPEKRRDNRKRKRLKVRFGTEESMKIATKLSNMPTKGIGLTKRALNLSMISDLTTQLKVEEELQTIAGGTHDYNEGVAAFLEKRKPEFPAGRTTICLRVLRNL